MKRFPLLLKIAGHLFFALLFVLSIVLYKERHAFDAAHYLFEIITREGFYIAHGRIIGFVSQLLPLAGVYLNASLKSLMLLYSFGDVLYYYCLFLISVYVFKSPSISISILLITCLAVKFSFYCPVTELLQGLVLVPFLNNLMYRFKQYKFHLIPLLLILIIFSHPLLFIVSGFVILYFIVQQNTNLHSKQNLFLLVTFFLITAAKFLVLDKYDYQKSFYPVVFNDYSNVINITNLEYVLSFLKTYFKENFLVGIVWIFSLYILIRNKRLHESILVFVMPVLYLVMIIVTHSFTSITNYSERMLLPFAGMISIAFAICYAGINSKWLKQSLLYILVVILGFRLWIIYDASFPYTKRVSQIEELIHQAHLQDISKCIADERNIEYLPYAMTGWSYSLESLLLSSINFKDSAVTIALMEEHYNRFSKKNPDKNEFYKTQDSIVSHELLNRNYFQLEEKEYMFLNTNDCKFENNSSPTFTFQNNSPIKSDNDYCYLPIVIFKKGNKLCSSVESGTGLFIDAFNVGDSAYRDSRFIPLQTDITDSLKQDLLFKTYRKKGKWKINVTFSDTKGNLKGETKYIIVEVR